MTFSEWVFRFSFISITVTTTVAGQLCLKKGMLQYTSSGNNIFLTLLKGLKDPWVIFGLFLAVVAACAWIIVLSRMPLSHAYPFISITFPMVVILSAGIFDEPMTVKIFIGLGLIVIGLIVISKGYAQ